MSRPTFCDFYNFRPRQNFELRLLQEFLAIGKENYITAVVSNCRKVRKLNWRRTGARCDERLSEGKSVEKLGYKQGLPFPKASLKFSLTTVDNEF